jgi:cholesterol 25-hydroxylase
MLPVEAPTITEITIHWAICFVVFDTEYYVWHVIHHKVSFLYKHIHSFHHRLRSPFSWGTQYVHPIELFFTVLFTMSTPLLLGSHPITFWIWMVTVIYVSVENHTGYDFPWSLSHILPFGIYGGVGHHDMHHLKPYTNFQPFFTWWDKLFGSEHPPLNSKPTFK